MSNLADQILENKGLVESGIVGGEHTKFFKNDPPKRDDLGMPTANSLDYMIARILYIDYNLSGREHLHLRDDDERIWEGNHWISEKRESLYRILKWKGAPLNQEQQAMIWARLRECLPTLSEDKMVIKDNLVWDKKKGELYFEDEKPLTIN